jgi:hypothetical protein
MAESISAKATTIKPAAKAGARATETAAVKTTAAEAAVTSATPRSAATKSVRHHVGACNSTNCERTYRCNKFFVVHKN